MVAIDRRRRIRTRWEFFYTSREVVFRKEARFLGVADAPESAELDKKKFDFSITVRPDEQSGTNEFDEERGSLIIDIPFERDDGIDLAKHLASVFAEKISFDQQGEFDVQLSAVIGEYVPETEEEQVAIGDAPYFAEMTLVEAIPPVEFSTERSSSRALSPERQSLVRQFNSSARVEHPIFKFLGFFKIIEDRYVVPGRRKTLLATLQAADELRLRIRDSLVVPSSGERLTNQQIDQFLSSLVEMRHQCAHLKSKVGFGLRSDDTRITSELMPLMLRRKCS